MAKVTTTAAMFAVALLLASQGDVTEATRFGFTRPWNNENGTKSLQKPQNDGDLLPINNALMPNSDRQNIQKRLKKQVNRMKNPEEDSLQRNGDLVPINNSLQRSGDLIAVNNADDENELQKNGDLIAINSVITEQKSGELIAVNSIHTELKSGELIAVNSLAVDEDDNEQGATFQKPEKNPIAKGPLVSLTIPYVSTKPQPAPPFPALRTKMEVTAQDVTRPYTPGTPNRGALFDQQNVAFDVNELLPAGFDDLAVAEAFFE